jgi:hypothetical protein
VTTSGNHQPPWSNPEAADFVPAPRLISPALIARISAAIAIAIAVSIAIRRVPVTETIETAIVEAAVVAETVGTTEVVAAVKTASAVKPAPGANR